MLNIFSVTNGNKNCNPLIALNIQCQFLEFSENSIDSMTGAVVVNTGPLGRVVVGGR